jgi:hypothetical protein
MSKPTFVNISGGRTSGFMGYLMRGLPDHHFIFQNTGREHPKTYDFLHKMETEWGLPITWLEYSCPDPSKKATFKIVDFETANRKGKPFRELIIKRHRAIPNQFKRFCTIEMKTKTARRYIRSLGCEEWYYALGYRADEPHRKTHDDIKAQRSITPLEWLNVTVNDVANFWSKQPFDLELPYMPNGKTFHGNCMGCFWHSEYQHAHLCKHHPEEYQWLVDQENEMGYTFNNNYSYEELREQLKDRDWDTLSQNDELCQAVNGTCGI